MCKKCIYKNIMNGSCNDDFIALISLKLGKFHCDMCKLKVLTCSASVCLIKPKIRIKGRSCYYCKVLKISTFATISWKKCNNNDKF